MAEKKSARAVTGNRIFDMPISNYIGNRLTGTWTGDKMWQPVNTNGVYAETYFDLSAYELDDLTLIPKLISLQDGMPYFATQVEGLDVFDVVSQERLNVTDFINYSIGGDYPSSPGSTEDWSQILFCNTRFLAVDSSITFADLMLPVTQGSFGSAEPTAVQKLWVYRVVLCRSAQDASTLILPATRFVLAADIVKEEDLPYIMRLKRSYELSTQG